MRNNFSRQTNVFNNIRKDPKNIKLKINSKLKTETQTKEILPELIFNLKFSQQNNKKYSIITNNVITYNYTVDKNTVNYSIMSFLTNLTKIIMFSSF